MRESRRESSAQRATPRVSNRAPSSRLSLAVLAGPFFLLALVLGWSLGQLPAWVALAYAAMSVITLACYRLDKSAAIHNRQRTPERSLHLLALAGGWPGALLAQSLFRHKSSKAAFLWRFWATVLLNLGLLAGWLANGWGVIISW